MVVEQGALGGRYSLDNPLLEGPNRAQAYNGMLPHLKVLTDRLASIGQKQGSAVPDVATAWAIAKGTTPIIGVTRPSYIDGLVLVTSIRLSSSDIAEFEALTGFPPLGLHPPHAQKALPSLKLFPDRWGDWIDGVIGALPDGSVAAPLETKEGGPVATGHSIEEEQQ